VFYVAYRVVLILFPTAALGQALIYPSNYGVICSHDEDGPIADSQPILSSTYKKRVQKQAAESANLVYNADLSQTDQDGPVGFSHSIDNKTSQYQYAQEPESNQHFLRVTTTDKKTTNDIVQPAWLMTSATISPDDTYAYSFEYRSNTTGNVSIEYSKGSSASTEYVEITSLQASKDWQHFTAHFDNAVEARTFRVIVDGKPTGQIDLRSFDIHKIASAELRKGIVSVTFDDGWQSAADAAPILQKYHIPTTQYIISEVADQPTIGYMDMGTVTNLKKAGDEIGSHSLKHCDQTKLDPGTIENDAKRSKSMLEQAQLGPVKSFAYPLGQYNEMTQAIISKYYPLIRTSDPGYNDRLFDETNIHAMGVLSKTDDATFQSWINYAKTHKQWLILIYHRIDESGDYSTTSAQLERQLSAIAKSGMDIMPISKAAESIRK
jgi:peptidoglycan/xylan/chitin deacetylase (PgdA/CDA1 family)